MQLKSLPQSIKESPVWLVTIFITIITVFFIYLPFQIEMFEDKKVEKVYYVDNISEAHYLIIDKFNEMHKGKIEVIPVNLPFHHFTTNDRKAILTRSLRDRSDGIDIFAVDLIWISRFAKWGYPLDRSISESILKDVTEVALQPCYQDNELVAFPTYLDLGILHYRKDKILALEDGKNLDERIQNSLTWEDFFELRKKLNKDDPYFIFQGSNYEGLICFFNELLKESEIESLFHEKPVNLNTESNRRAFAFIKELFNMYNSTPTIVNEFDEFKSYKYALENNATFLRGWVGFHKQYKSFLKDSSIADLMDVAPLPHFNGQKKTSVFGGWSLMISKYSARKEEALKFLKFMFNEDNQKLLYEIGGVLPVNKKVYTDSSYMLNNHKLLQFYNLLKWGKHRSALHNYTKISEILSDALHQVIRGELDVESALNEASENINKEKALN